ncbi:MAG: hypothetical protein IPM45_04320 [Acidimicrobiales bacterium]|nr:hypothetical protein [Acidimicrobiales bacterium]
MRVLFTTIPGHGHLLPMVPLAHALVAAGHEVRVATSPSFCPTVERCGLVALPLGLDWLEGEVERLAPAVAGLAPPARSAAIHAVLSAASPLSMVQALDGPLMGWGAELVVAETAELGGPLAAERAGVPYAQLSVSVPSTPSAAGIGPSVRVDARGPTAVPYHLLRQRLQLPPAPVEAATRRFLTLDQMPASLHFGATSWLAPTRRPIRPVAYAPPGPADPVVDDALDDDRPLVLVTLGTVFHRAADVIRAVVDGLAAEDLAVLVATGGLPLDDLPPNTHAAPWVPNDRVIPRAAVVVHHGGPATALACLAAGVPALALPQAADQGVMAIRVRNVGAGRLLGPGVVTPRTVQTAVRVLLADRLYRANAARIGEDIAAMPEPAALVPVLEQLARDGEPVAGVFT